LKSINSLNQLYDLNQDGLEIVITDIVENAHKYNNGHYALKFIEDERSFHISFENGIKEAEMNPELEKLVSDFSSNNKLEINKRITHGMTMIKSFLEQMKIVHNLSIENGVFILKLTFNK
jgi:hypothetical protein